MALYLEYDDETSMLYHLHGLVFRGPSSSEGSDYCSSLPELIQSFASAQKTAASRCEAGAWADDKAMRKEHWLCFGVHEGLIIPTLLTGALVGVGGGSGAFCAKDSNCKGRLEQLLEEHKALVLKPTHGVNSSGVLVVSIAAEPLRFVPPASGERRECPRCHPTLPAKCVWAFSPAGAGVQKEGVESVGCYRRDEWFSRLVCADELTHDVGGERGSFLVEACIPYDQEVSVLAINGGRVMVLAGRANSMERLLMLEGQPTLVAASDFSPPSCRSHVVAPDQRGRHTAMLLQQVARGHPPGETLHATIREAVYRIARALGAAAVRVDFFVRWGDSDGSRPASVRLNEVEHGFAASAMLGWFGAPLTDYALRAWALGGDPEQQARSLMGAPPPGRLPPSSFALPFDEWLRAYEASGASLLRGS